jgi:TRAP-type transport system periplasmic protein
MRIARRTFLVSSIASVAAPAILRVARADAPPLTLKLHHSFSAVSSVHDKFLAPWARKVEAESGGRLRIDIFPSMQLGGAPAALFDQARDGVTDIAWAAPSRTPGRFTKIETFELPFLASSRSLVSSKALTDFAAVNLKDEFREVYPLCFSCSDRAVLHASGPVRTTEDVKNLKIHVQTRLAGEAVRALGAHPVLMPSAQLPDAIGQHVVDACVDPWHVVPPLRLNELLRAHTEFSDLSFGSRTYVLAMNKDVYGRLPHDLKIVIDNNSGQSAASMAGAMWDIQAAAVANMAVERGDLIVTLLPEAVAHWRKATEPVIEAWRKTMKEQRTEGAKLLLGARALLAKYANEPQPRPTQTPPAEQDVVAEPQPQQTGRDVTPKFNNAPAGNASPNNAPPGSASSASPAPSPTPSAAAPSAPAPSGPIAKPAPQPPSQATPASPVATPAPATPPTRVAKPAPPAGPAPQIAAPARAAPPASAASATPATASVAPTPAPVPSPAPPPSVAAAPPPPAPPVPPVPKPVPKTLDIPL